jgi:hypothetical protein
VQSPLVDVVIHYHRLEPTEITGHVLGVLQTAREFERFFCQGTPFYSFVSEGPSGDKVEGRRILIPQCSVGWSPADTDPVRPIAWFNCDEVEEAEAPARRAGARVATAKISGPTFAWAVGSSWREMNDGFQLKVFDPVLDLGAESRFSVSVGPGLEHDRQEGSPIRSFGNVFCVKLETDESADEWQDEEFAREAEQAIEDLTVIASFLSRRRVEAFEFSFMGAERLRRVRKVASGVWTDSEERSSPVHGSQFREFFKDGFAAYRRLRGEGTALRLPILQLVSSYRSAFADENFYAAENALAKLVALLKGKKETQPLVNEATRNRIKRALEEGMVEAHGSGPGRDEAERVWSALAQKLAELGTSAREVLQDVLSTYGVQWQDLYPAGTRTLTLFATRAGFYHGADEIEIERLIKERRRCQALVERLILRLLGWVDLGEAPSEWELRWLREG